VFLPGLLFAHLHATVSITDSRWKNADPSWNRAIARTFLSGAA
jgi:hypothetical protein